jgi:hypothetical protein
MRLALPFLTQTTQTLDTWFRAIQIAAAFLRCNRPPFAAFIAQQL